MSDAETKRKVVDLFFALKEALGALPCPRCHGSVTATPNEIGGYDVSCTDCEPEEENPLIGQSHTYWGSDGTKQEAIDAWNKKVRKWTGGGQQE